VDPRPRDPAERAVGAVRARLSARGSALPDSFPDPTPRVWAILCERTGDNAQIRALAEALGWKVEVKRLAYRRFGRLLDVWRGANRMGIVSKRSSPLRPPWPDLVISASMRNEPICRWIRKQSGGRTRYVHIGKPWAALGSFDLVITVPEYHWLPRRPNVLHNASALTGVNARRLADEARRFAPHVAHLPRPFIAVLVGGYAGPYPFDREQAERLGREASAMASKAGGSLLVTTSARTSRAAIEGLVAAIDAPHALFRWSADAPENPYFGFLGLADALIVTCDSTSMLAEACATGKPVFMVDLAGDGVWGDAPLEARPESGRLVRWMRRCNADRLRAFLYRNLMLRFAPDNVRRDIGAVHRALLASGRAVWLGQPAPSHRPPPLDEMPRSLERVRALFEDGASEAQRSAAALGRSA
jgi:mitochondrial fission protein ELM1